MKVLITCLSKSWGGLEMFALQTALQLSGKGTDTELLCFYDSPLHNEAKQHSIPIRTSRFSGYFKVSEIIKTSNLLKQNNYDIIHCGASKDLWLIVPALKYSSLTTPLLLSKQMGSYIGKKDFLHKIIYKRVKYALAISNVIAQNLVDTTPLTKDKILLLHNAVDTGQFDPEKIDRMKVRNEFNINDDELLLGMIARFSPGKGHEEFLYSAKHLLERHNNLRFMIVGEPSMGEDNYGEKIKSMVSDLGLSQKVFFTGFRKDTPEIIAAMDIFVFPSHAEAFGIALAEALSMGKPSVCSSSDGVLDIAVDDLTSYLFKKQSWKDLAEKTDKLIQSPETRKRFGQAARKRAVELFDIGVFTNKLIGIYKKVINN